jgi:two-component system NtrC family sensor kinase
MNGSTRRAAVLVGTALLAAVGLLNLVQKATWSYLDDGVYWEEVSSGLRAVSVATHGAGAQAGLRPGDLLLRIDGERVLSTASFSRTILRHLSEGPVRYEILREGRSLILPVSVRSSRQSDVSLFYYLSVVGFLSLFIGTYVLLRRPPDRSTLHFGLICLLFFLVYSISYTGRLDLFDWILLWADSLATLYLPVVFLHFCLLLPERRPRRWKRWLSYAAYVPPTCIACGAAITQILFVLRGASPRLLWGILDFIDRVKPLYFALFFAAAFIVLVDVYRHTHRAMARKQMKWLVWGTGAGILPFLVFYAIPFALRREPRLALELAGYIPLSLITLSLAYAVIQHRLMDVEVLFRRALVYVLAVLALVGASLLVVGLARVGLASDSELHASLVAVLCTLVAVLLFTPVKRRIQDAVDRVSYRERYASRKALLRLSQEINADLNLDRITDRLQAAVRSALGVDAVSVFLPSGAAGATQFHPVSSGTVGPTNLPEAALPALASGRAVHGDADPSVAGGLAYLFPCLVGGTLIAVLGVGRAGMDPLNSEEVDLMLALAGQVGTAIMNARLYHSLADKAAELEGLTRYNESILESLSSGVLVLDLDERAVRWNRTMERLTGLTRAEALGLTPREIFPASILPSVTDSLRAARRGAVGHAYKLRLGSRDDEDVIVDLWAVPFDAGHNPSGTIVVLEDITDRVRLEAQLQHSDKMASIGLLAAGVAHEVNTPLAGISSYAQLLRGQIDPTDPRGVLAQKIETQSFRAAEIISSLLRFSRSADIEQAPVDINRVLLDVLALSELQLTSVNVKVRQELAPQLPAVRGSASRLQQVFFNLISNARDAMPHGGWLTVATWSEVDSIIAEVRDTGDGIPRDHIRRIYDPFFTTKGVGRGTGLGLSVAYGIVQDHRGSISVESVPRVGTAFRVALPALEAQEAARSV